MVCVILSAWLKATSYCVSCEALLFITLKYICTTCNEDPFHNSNYERILG